MTGAQILVHYLQDEGVEHIWGYPGGAVLPIYDALDTDGDELNHILVRHEQAAVHVCKSFNNLMIRKALSGVITKKTSQNSCSERRLLGESS